MRRVGGIAMVGAMLMTAAPGCGGGAATVVKTVTTTAPARIQALVIARRDPAAIAHEPGAHHGAPGCRIVAGGRVKTIPLRSDAAGCFQVRPRDRLLFVNSTGLGSKHGESNPVHVSLGGWEASIDAGQSALFPRPLDTFLGIGLHSVYTDATARRPSILVLPEGCATKDPKPGESLCFAAGAPPCHGSELAIHTRMGGAGAGTYYQSLLVINRSSHDCTVAGFPTVFALDARGRAVAPPIPTSGAATTMSGKHPHRIALEPAGAATFEMNIGDAANYSRSACRPWKAVALRIRIPNSGGATHTLPYGMEFCASGANASVGRIE